MSVRFPAAKPRKRAAVFLKACFIAIVCSASGEICLALIRSFLDAGHLKSSTLVESLPLFPSIKLNPFPITNMHRSRICIIALVTTNYNQGKFRNLTSDYIESCRPRSVKQEMSSRRCETAEVWEMRRFWRVGIAQNPAFFHFFHNFVAPPARKVTAVPKNGRVQGPAAEDAAKICTALWRGSDLEVKNRSRVSDHFLKFKIHFTWQAQGFRHSIHIKIVKRYCNSEVRCLVNMWFLKQVARKSCSYSASQLVS